MNWNQCTISGLRLILTGILFLFFWTGPLPDVFATPEVSSSADPQAQPLPWEKQLEQGAQFLSGGNMSDSARSLAAGAASGAAQSWLSQFGTARVSLNTRDDFSPDLGSLDLLVPFLDKPGIIGFTQAGWRNTQGRHTGNAGIGVRWFTSRWMYGMNTFFDDDFTGKNRRTGLGIELWGNNLKLSSNGYFRLTGWHQSRDFADYDERPANGFDVRAEGYLPGYPQLGAKAVYEKYYGRQVALFGQDHRENNPQAVTLGVSYTPVPLITLSADLKDSQNGGNHEGIFGLALNYSVGVPLSVQLDPGQVTSKRQLSGSRLDLVERNNAIVLDYRKQELIRLSIDKSLTGVSQSEIPVMAAFSSKYPLSRISWQGDVLNRPGASIRPASGGSPQIPVHQWILTLPAWDAGGHNTYTLQAQVSDDHNNVSELASGVVTVTDTDHSLTPGALVCSPDSVSADNQSVSTCRISVTDSGGLPVAHVPVTWQATLGALSSEATETDSNGQSSVTLSAGVAGESQIIATLAKQQVQSRVTFVPAVLNTSLTARPSSIVANGNDAAKLALTVVNALNVPVTGLDVHFVNESTDIPVSIGKVTESWPGIYEAQVTGIRAGDITLTSRIDNVAVGKAVHLTLIPGALDPGQSDFSVSPAAIAADGQSLSTLTFTAKDGQGNLISGLKTAFTSIARNVPVSVSDAQEDSPGHYTATLSGNSPGDATMNVTTGSSPVSGLASQTIHLFAAHHISKVEVTEDYALADGLAQDRVRVTVVDSLGRPQQGQRVTFSADQGITPVQATVITDAGGQAQTGMISTVAGAGIVTAVLEGSASSSVGVTFESQLKFAQIAANGLVLNADSANGFPHTAFKGAFFTFTEARGVATDVDWKSSDSRVSVENGKVTFMDRPASSAVSVTMVSRRNPANKATYTFRLKKWFVETPQSSWSGYAKKCAALGLSTIMGDDYTVSILNEYGSGTPSQRGNDGRLWSEWGNLNVYGWSRLNDWTGERGPNTGGYVTHLTPDPGSGRMGMTYGPGATGQPGACMAEY